jgi:hypothetical protein
MNTDENYSKNVRSYSRNSVMVFMMMVGLITLRETLLKTIKICEIGGSNGVAGEESTLLG